MEIITIPRLKEECVMHFIPAKSEKQTMPHHRVLRLAADDLVCMKGRGLLRIQCGSGRVWITWPIQGDVILDSGQSVVVSTRGKVCIWAFHTSSVQVWEASGTGAGRRAFAGLAFNRS